MMSDLRCSSVIGILTKSTPGTPFLGAGLAEGFLVFALSAHFFSLQVSLHLAGALAGVQSGQSCLTKAATDLSERPMDLAMDLVMDLDLVRHVHHVLRRRQHINLV